jgi:DNA-binding SARP family transcriptional activator/tRNA A-37 threonylcarbamoyl transferase component Bud32
MNIPSRKVRIYLTGGVRVERGGALVRQRSFSFPHAALAFAYFVCERGRPIPAAELSRVLWPEAPPADAGIEIQAITQKLRRTLARHALASTLRLSSSNLYELEAPNDTWVDIEAAADAIHDAEGELRANRPAGAFGPSAIAHHIARRPFLAGESGPWVESQRERLRGILVRALECRGEVFLWNREVPLAIEAAKEAIALEPFRETAHQLLIRAHVALGNAADAKRAFNHCRELLATRLGIEPSPQTERVYHGALGVEHPGDATTTEGRSTLASQSLRSSSDLKAELQRLLRDSYRIDGELGGGGMSRVFLAEERALGRRVVIKVLPPERAETLSTERFAREVRLAAKLQQANIVPLLSAAVVGGIPYYTMPFVSGASLRAILSEGTPVPIPRVISILRDVARALAFAHEHGIVHRDIKPENILISGATAVVTDFGIGKAIEQAQATAAETRIALTGVNACVGTPAYMAPEQIAADPAIDHRADIYSFGIVGYELLAGRSPFADRSAQAALAAHLGEQLRDVREVRMDTPQTLDELVMRCVKKDPNLRPQSMEEVLAALE